MQSFYNKKEESEKEGIRLWVDEVGLGGCFRNAHTTRKYQ
jgi:hypothetical protein